MKRCRVKSINYERCNTMEFWEDSTDTSLRADVSYFLPPAEKGRLRNGVANRVPVSCCSGFKFRINHDNTVLFSVPESFPSDAPWSEVEQD